VKSDRRGRIISGGIRPMATNIAAQIKNFFLDFFLASAVIVRITAAINEKR
jgi:hypothetical protein